MTASAIAEGRAPTICLAKGLSAGKKEGKHGIRASNTTSVILEDVVVPAENLIGGVEGEGLKQAIEQGDAAGEIAARLDELIHYLDAHFMSEQLAMREHAYPGYEAHVREHDDAIDLLRKLESRCKSGEGDVAMEILGALRGWLIGHIQTTDHALAEFMKSRGVELH